MRAALTAVLALTAVSLFPSTAAAQLPVGKADGVRIVRERGAIVVVFPQRAERLWRRVAGRRVDLACHDLLDADGELFQGVGSGNNVLRAPKRGRRLRTGDLSRWDYCRLWLQPRTVRRNGERLRMGRTLIVSIPLTQRAAIHLDEESKAQILLGLGFAAAFIADDLDLETYPTFAQILERAREPRRGQYRLVELPTADATPPAGAVGYYSDGQQHVAMAILSASGRRLFIEYEGDGVLRTNVAGHIYGDSDLD